MQGPHTWPFTATSELLDLVACPEQWDQVTACPLQ